MESAKTSVSSKSKNATGWMTGAAVEWESSVMKLEKIVDDPLEPVRVAAYEAMIRRGEHTVIERTRLGEFNLDVVKTNLVKTVYATQSGVPKIVLMGKDIPMQREIYFSNEDVMISSDKDGDLTVVRKIQRGGRLSDPIRVPATVLALVKAMGEKAQKDVKGKFSGLGLSHGQIVAVLYGMCKQHDIEANFVLQQTGPAQTIYHSGPATVRPELPE